MSTLLLRIAAPIQSWGVESKLNTRGTEREPTKSGIIGLIASALGYSRNQSLDQLNELKFGVRVDQEGKLVHEFQTAHVQKEKGYRLSNRYYLCDAVFLVGLESNDIHLLEEINSALKEPRYPLFLGRRSCPPTLPISLGLRNESLEVSLKNEDWLASEYMRRYENGHLRIYVDGDVTDGVQMDLPLSFSPFERKYRIRHIKNCGYVDKKNIKIEHNPFKELG